MATVILRNQKGSALTNTELDSNFTNINAETVDNSAFYGIRPSLDVDLVGSKTVSPLMGFSRASTATYYDANGVLRTAGINEPRFNYDPVTGELKGLLVESNDNLYISKLNWFNQTNGTLVLSHDAPSGQPILGDGANTIMYSRGPGTINIDYSNSQLSVVSQTGTTTTTEGIFNFDSDLYIMGNSATKANAHVRYLKFYPNNAIGSTPDGSGFILDDGYALLQEDGSVIFQE
jgi:hypothetical protein